MSLHQLSHSIFVDGNAALCHYHVLESNDITGLKTSLKLFSKSEIDKKSMCATNLGYGIQIF